MHDVRRYFNIMCAKAGDLAVYGPEQHTEFINVAEGVRQGDAFSGFFFSLLMERVSKRLAKIFGRAVITRLFFDDITLSCHPRNAKWVAARAMQELAEVGFLANISKSSILAPDLVEGDNDGDRDISDEPINPLTATQIDEITSGCVEPTVPARPALRRYEWSDTQLATQRGLESEACEEMCKYNVALVEFYSSASPHSSSQNDAAANSDIIQIINNIKIVPQQEPFVVLGANISRNYEQYNSKQQHNLCGFFDVLEKVGLHPQLAFTLAHFCGFTKARYYAAATPPEHSEAVLTAFNNKCCSFLEKLFDFDVLGQPFAHHKHGLGIPDYLGRRNILYTEMRNAAILSVPSQPVELVNVVLDEDETALRHRSAQENASWLQYQPNGYDTRMQPIEFRISMAIRCRTLPRFIMDRKLQRCPCNNAAIATPGELIDHALNCRGIGFSPSHRHSLIKAEVAKIFRRSNFAVTLEPNFYCYNDGKNHRPDLTIFAPHPVATDFVICQQDTVPGTAANREARKKLKTHTTAVTSAGHHFVPFALEAHGHEHSSVQAFVKAAMQFRPQFEELQMMRDIRVGVSVALARARINSVLAVIGQCAWTTREPLGDRHVFDEEL